MRKLSWKFKVNRTTFRGKTKIRKGFCPQILSVLNFRNFLRAIFRIFRTLKDTKKKGQHNDATQKLPRVSVIYKGSFWPKNQKTSLIKKYLLKTSQPLENSWVHRNSHNISLLFSLEPFLTLFWPFLTSGRSTTLNDFFYTIFVDLKIYFRAKLIY